MPSLLFRVKDVWLQLYIYIQSTTAPYVFYAVTKYPTDETAKLGYNTPT